MMNEMINEICGLMVQLIRFNRYDELQQTLEEIQEIEETQEIQNETLNEIREAAEIYRTESESSTGAHSAWFDEHSWEQIQLEYGRLCSLLFESAEAGEGGQAEILRAKIASGRVTHDAVRKAMCRLTLQEKTLELPWTVPEKPLVSVVICVYNGEAFVRDTLESIVGQTYRNMEIIVIDDASSDGSREIIKEYARKDERIVPVFLEKNLNICNAGNVGFERATGKYAALIGHDDIWRKDKLEKQISFLEEHPTYSVCFSWAEIIDENGESINKKYGMLRGPFCCENFNGKDWTRRMFFKQNELCASSACIRRECLERTGGYRYALVQLQDYDLWLRLLLEGNIYVLQEKLVFYRKFTDTERNLSAGTEEASVRGWHELQWIQYNYIYKMSDEKFRFVFGKDLKKPELVTCTATMCEKAFLLCQIKNCFAVKLFVELLEDSETREFLEKEYQFTLQDFYKMNAQRMPFDTAWDIT